ncbi:Integrin alpha-5 [Echinococcus granulosus]|nr:Integrin alpha-5 [Echinococcus granulosus]
MHSKGVIIYIITGLLIQRSATAIWDELKHRLEAKSTVDLADELEELNAQLWNPQTGPSDRPDHWIFRHYLLPQFNYDALVTAKRAFDENFLWSSISLLSLPQYNVSFLLLGGSWSRHNDPPYPREDGIVQLCKFMLSPSGQLTFTPPCQDLSEGLNNTSYLGATSVSLQISQNMGLVAYCDPLWRDESHFPAGRCYLQLLHNENIRPRHELASFCRTGGKVTEPCMTGFSVDLMSKSRVNSGFLEFLKGIHVIVGQPLAIGYGRVQILADPFYYPRTFTVYRPSGLEITLPESYFGYSVAGEYVSVVGDGFRQMQETSNASELIQVFKVGDLQSIRTAGGVEFDWQGRVDKTGSFSGFGTSMIRLKNVDGQDIIVVGSPYAPKGGRVYAYCIPTNLAVDNSKRQAVPTDTYRDFVSAPAGSGAFGYSLAALGDINGDGQEDIAVGAPQLRNESKSGLVFILSILNNCTFDRRPIQVISGPEKTAYFGSILPRKGIDLDFNGWSDFALPVPYCSSCMPMVYTSRSHYQAACRFYQPNWLGSVRIRRNARIPIRLKVRLIPSGKNNRNSFEQILQAANVKVQDLVHQVIPDLWAKEAGEQRVRLSTFHSVKMNAYYDMLSLKFDLLPQMDVEDMPSLEQPDGGIRVQYRFNIPCPDGAKAAGDTKTCLGGAWVHRPIIDWSACNFQLRLTKYVCLPQGRCESDVSLLVTDEESAKFANFIHSNPSGETLLIYGDKERAMNALIINIYNHGPTFAGGVWINMAFFGNLRFSAFEVARRSDDNGSLEFKPAICSHPLYNDTWVACNLGRLDFSQGNVSSPVQRIRLTSFYAANSGTVNKDFSLPSFVNISISSQTYDPQPQNNHVIWQYKLLHAPKYLITPAGHAPSSVLDNRTRPTSWGPGFHQRIRVEEMGPQIRHIFQVEHMGPAKSVENVTIRLRVPVRMANRAKPLVYLFNEVRAPSPNGIDMEWVSLRPVVKQIGASVNDVDGVTSCWYNDESLINPNGWIGIDMSSIETKRVRRDAPTPFDSNSTELMQWHYNSSDTLGQAAGRFGNEERPQKVSFRRVPKEVIQCGRVGQKFGKPLCLEIICHLRQLKKKHPVQISVTGWLYAPTFFQYSTSDIEIVTSLTVDQGAVPKGVLRSPEPVGSFNMPQIFYFTKIKPTIFYKIPIWPIVVGLVLGILLLTLLILILYRFGFFRRRKHKLAVSGRRRWHETLAEEISKRGTDEVDRGGSDLDTFSSIRYAEEARKRRLKLRKHPEEVSILHPDEIPKDNEGEGQDNPTALFEHASTTNDPDTVTATSTTTEAPTTTAVKPTITGSSSITTVGD